MLTTAPHLQLTGAGDRPSGAGHPCARATSQVWGGACSVYVCQKCPVVAFISASVGLTIQIRTSMVGQTPNCSDHLARSELYSQDSNLFAHRAIAVQELAPFKFGVAALPHCRSSPIPPQDYCHYDHSQQLARVKKHCAQTEHHFCSALGVQTAARNSRNLPHQS